VNGVGQLGRAVKAIDSKSIGVTRVSSNLTAVDLFSSPFDPILHFDCKYKYTHRGLYDTV